MDNMDKFANLEKIGEGAFGEVYKATHKLTGKTCALKRIKEIDQSALDEVEALQTVKDHPNIASIQSYFIARSSLWVVTRFCEGGDLNQYFWDKKPDVNVKFRFMKQMASAVAFLHDKGVAHRDLKPENILIALDEKNEPQVQLADFGIAKIHCGEQMTHQFMTTCAGTALFFAPEVLDTAVKGGRYTSKADVFSLGVIFRAMIFDAGLSCGENKKYLVACFFAEGNPIPYSQAMIGNRNLVIKVRADLLESSSARQLLDGMFLRNETSRLSAKAVSEALGRMRPSDFLPKPSATKQAATASPETESAATSGNELLSRFTQTVRTVKPTPKKSDDVSSARRLTDALHLFSKEELSNIKHQILVLYTTLARNVSPAAKLQLQAWVLPVIGGLDKVYRGERLGDEEAVNFAVGWLQFHSIFKD